MERLETIRVEAARRMGMPGSAAVPKVGVVAAPAAFTALDGVAYTAAEAGREGSTVAF
jgi:2-methylaconitate cis-trans-isomerase PrpF